MSNKPPADIALAVKVAAFRLADEFGYLNRPRTENAQFMLELTANVEVGGILRAYMPEQEIRTYIKDAVLNRYSKQMTRASRPSDVPGLIRVKFGFSCMSVESDRQGDVELFGSGRNYVVVTFGTYLKWETALRKALLYLPGKPFAQDPDNRVHILLLAFNQGKPVGNAEQRFLDEALSRFHARAHIYGL